MNMAGMMNAANSPLVQVAMAMRQGQDPLQVLQRLAAQDPRAAQAIHLLQNKSPQQLREIAENMAKERGTTTADIARSMGIQFPGGR